MVIGFLVGGVLVGKDLIRASEVRAQISQMEKLYQAVNTFKGKYNFLPGDMKDPDATQFGFLARGQYAGQGDGDSLITGSYCNNGSCPIGVSPTTGETGTFWVDLSTARLIDGSFSSVTPTTYGIYATTATIKNFLPAGKIGSNSSVYVFSTTNNYFGLSSNVAANNWFITSTPGLTVAQAYAIDKKIDDGLPQSGNVLAMYYNYTTSNYSTSWAAGGGAVGAGTGFYGELPSTAATAGSATTCFDNNATAGATQQYSITQNNGTGVNCALSFKFQ